uniref:Uncharacterized protein n=1 Tax=Strongyloides stercoralis TaxID=6248 RepID=A0A0K0E1W1_STRER
MPFIFIAYVVIRIFGYSNDFMSKAVLLSEKLDSDTLAAKQLNREQYNKNRCFVGQSKFSRSIKNDKVEILKKIKEILDDDPQTSIRN